MKGDPQGARRFVKSMWCGDRACEEKVKEETGMPSRCMPFEQEHIADVCPVCGKPASKMIVLGYCILIDNRLFRRPAFFAGRLLVVCRQNWYNSRGFARCG